MRVAGVMSGTSVDGIDVAILEFEKTFEVLGHHSIPYAPEVRQAILAVSNATAHISAVARLHFLLGELYASAVQETCKRLGIPIGSIDLIGCHGQTIFHEGDPVDFLGHRIASTLQIGDAAVIAKRTAIPVIADFRPDDIAAGGKGAPLVPVVDYRLFRHEDHMRIALNLGGIANITVIPAGAWIEDVVAFDTGPGNMVMDGLTGSFDRDGAVASQGHVNEALLKKLLENPYYRQSPPKTAGREQYGSEFLRHFAGLSLEDAVATATELTVRTVALAIERYSEAVEVIASGGGTHNRWLMNRLCSALKPQLKTTAEYGIDVDAKEAIAFAVLAYESFHGRPGNVPSATGASKAVILGKSTTP